VKEKARRWHKPSAELEKGNVSPWEGEGGKEEKSMRKDFVLRGMESRGQRDEEGEIS